MTEKQYHSGTVDLHLFKKRQPNIMSVTASALVIGGARLPATYTSHKDRPLVFDLTSERKWRSRKVGRWLKEKEIDQLTKGKGTMEEGF